MRVSDAIKFGISRLVDGRSAFDVSYAATTNNNNNNITKSLNEPTAVIDDGGAGGGDDDEEAARRRRVAVARNIWSPLRSRPSSVASGSSAELDVDSVGGGPAASPDIDVTKGATPPPPPPKSLPLSVPPPPPSRPPPVKNSEAFSVSALLKPDVPRSRHPYNHQQQQQQPVTASMAETVSVVTRSLLYPAVQFPDLVKDAGRKDVQQQQQQQHMHPSAANTLLQKHFSGFGFHPHFYTAAAAGMLNPSPGSPEHGGDAHTDSNHNHLFTNSLYLSLSAVQAAAAAAAFAHPLSAAAAAAAGKNTFGTDIVVES